MNKTTEIPGMIRNEPNEIYHANPSTSFSNLKTFIKSPKLFKMHQDGLIPHEHKDAWDIGSAVHEAVLEPGKESEYYLTEPDYKGTTKAGKELKAEVEANGQKLINASNSATVRACIMAIHKSPAAKLFIEGEAEVSWRTKIGQVLNVQCRTDWICHEAPAGLEEFGILEGDRYVADLKTSQSLGDWDSDSQWKNPLVKPELFYAGQEAFYTPVINTVLMAADEGRIDKWVFVVVEKELPNRVAVIVTPGNARDYANAQVGAAVAALCQCVRDEIFTDEITVGAYEPQIRIY